MVDVRRVTLPGIGVLHSFFTGDGSEVAVVAHRTGSSDLVTRPTGGHVHDDGANTVRLDEDEAHTLAELLGGTRIVESIAELDELPGVPIDWVTVEAADAIAGRAIGDLPVASGVAIVAVVRDDHAHPSPAPDFIVRPGDTIVVVGPNPGIGSVFRAVHHGDAHPGDAEA
ncbi:cation:proton antiporter regulatory subunit [Agromyces bauzanensis]